MCVDEVDVALRGSPKADEGMPWLRPVVSIGGGRSGSRSAGSDGSDKSVSPNLNDEEVYAVTSPINPFPVPANPLPAISG